MVGIASRTGTALGSENKVLALALLGWRIWARLMIYSTSQQKSTKLIIPSENTIFTWLLGHLVSLGLPHGSFLIFADILLSTPQILNVRESPRSRLETRTSSASLTRSKMSSKLLKLLKVYAAHSIPTGVCPVLMPHQHETPIASCPEYL